MKDAQEKVDKVAKKPAASDKEQMVNEYASELRPLIGRLMENKDDLLTLINVGVEDPALLSSYEYQDTAQLICDEIQRNVEEVRAIGAQEDELGSIHLLALKGAGELEFVAQNFPFAVEISDTDLLLECAQSFEKAGTFMDQATINLDKLSEEF
ncbi:hypothetical protein ACIQWI_21390 [Peribacillus frigoritolerans]